jgi:two-component system capsular synthesis sensor histidine kinase RcsC
MSKIDAIIDMTTSSLGQDRRRRRFSGHTENRAADNQVLVVDDDATICDSIAKILESFGYEVFKAEDAIAAMSLLAIMEYDLVITDFEMPLMDGYRLSAWLKQESPNTIVIIMTGSCQAEVNQFMATGLVDKWLFKPFSLKELREALRKLEMPTECCQSN